MKEIIFEMARLLDKTGLENMVPYGQAKDISNQALDTALINLKSLNARYEKNEALSQIQWLMDRYNIQIDELMERIVS